MHVKFVDSYKCVKNEKMKQYVEIKSFYLQLLSQAKRVYSLTPKREDRLYSNLLSGRILTKFRDVIFCFR